MDGWKKGAWFAAGALAAAAAFAAVAVLSDERKNFVFDDDFLSDGDSAEKDAAENAELPDTEEETFKEEDEDGSAGGVHGI